MHDLGTIYKKIKRAIKTECKEYFVYGDNTRFYPNPPKLSDLDVISLALSSEAVQIDSENLLWSKIKKDYSNLFPDLPHRTRFNSRRKQLRELTLKLMAKLSNCIEEESEILIIDSMPIPTCKIAREKFSKACRRPDQDELVASKGYDTVNGGYYIGYKIHLIVTLSGVYKDLLLTPANVHDHIFLKELSYEDDHLNGYELLGDRAYLGKGTQLRLFEQVNLKLNVPYRRNQKDYKKYPKHLKIIRKRIETVFAQFCDEFMMKRNYAKRFSGFETRILTKVLCKTFKQFWNFINGNEINKTKHSLAD